MHLLKPIVVSAVTIFILAWFSPSVSYLDWTTLLLAAVVLTLLNRVAKPILNLLFLPINIVTLGIFSVIINVALIWLVTYLVPGFSIEAITLFGYELNTFMTLVVVSVALGLLQNVIGFIL